MRYKCKGGRIKEISFRERAKNNKLKVLRSRLINDILKFL
jgi:hypothetical protein